MNESELKDIVIKLVKEKQWLEEQYNRELTERENSDILVSKIKETLKIINNLSSKTIYERSSDSECKDMLVEIVNILGRTLE